MTTTVHSTPYPIEERNKLLLEFFTNRGFDCKLLGNINQPKLVIDDTYAISGYVHNKLYHFTSKPFGGEVVYTVNLTFCEDVTKDKIASIIDSTSKRTIWKIVTTEGLYYVRTELNQPLFSPVGTRFFFDKLKAEETFDWLVSAFSLDLHLIETP